MNCLLYTFFVDLLSRGVVIPPFFGGNANYSSAIVEKPILLNIVESMHDNNDIYAYAFMVKGDDKHHQKVATCKSVLQNEN